MTMMTYLAMTDMFVASSEKAPGDEMGSHRETGTCVWLPGRLGSQNDLLNKGE